MSRDVFLCHASEDKKDVARPLAAACQANGITCWLDEAEIEWGDSLTGTVNNGLSEAQYVIVVLTESFVNKHWPERELNSALNLEASSGEVKVLPMLVGNEMTRKRILKQYPLLNDKRYLIWDGDPAPAVTAILKRLGRSRGPSSGAAAAASSLTFQPKIKRRFTDRERDKFLKAAYVEVREYFVLATHELAEQEPRIDAEVEQISSSKFVCQVFVDGDLRLKCKIWRSSGAHDNAISYLAGLRIDVASDNTSNEILRVDDDGHDLFFKGALAIHYHPLKGKANAQDIAQYLWRQFVQPLEQ